MHYINCHFQIDQKKVVKIVKANPFMKFIYLKLIFLGLIFLPVKSAYSQQCDCATNNLIQYNPGLTKEGKALSDQRNDPEKALGIPEINDTYNFVSLGFGGEIILSFDNAILNGPANDIRVVETTFNNETCESYPERMELFVSQDAISWISLGTGCLDSDFGIPAHLPWIKYVKIKDISDPAAFKNIDDGFDVDGVLCLNGPYTELQPVLPTLKCIRPIDTDYQAFFGYDNQNAAEINIPVGYDNFFNTQNDLGQSTIFQSGINETAFQVIFDGSDLVWTLEGPDGTREFIIANSQSPVCDATVATAFLSGSKKICSELETATLSVDLIGSPPFNLKYQEPDGNLVEVSDISDPVYLIEASKIGSYHLIEVFDQNGQGVISGEGIIELQDKPDLILNGESPYCAGLPIEGMLVGTGPWSIEYLDPDQSKQILTNIGQAEFMIALNESGIYEIIAVEDQLCRQVFDTPLSIEIHQTPESEISGAGFICDASEPAEIKITSKGTGPFTIIYQNPEEEQIELTDLPAEFTFTGSTPGLYTLISMEDMYCTGITSGSAEIKLNDKPQIDFDQNISYCPGSEISIDLAGSGPWNITYLDSNQETVSMNEITNSPFNLTLFEPGIYEFKSISDQNCHHELSEALKLTINETPTASISGGGIICNQGDLAEVALELTGIAPWTIVYKDAADNLYTIEDIEEPAHVFTFDAATTLELVSVNDANCSGIVSGQAIIQVAEKPSLALSKSEFCQGEKVPVSLTGNGPWSITWKPAAGPQQILEIVEQQAELTFPEPGKYEILAISDQDCQTTFETATEIVINAIPTAMLSGETSFCEGSSGALQIDLTGTAPWNLIYVDAEGHQNTIEQIVTDNYQLEVTGTSDYSLVSVTDANCSGSVSGSGKSKEFEQPSALISGGGEFCAGEEKAEITITLNGTAPFSFEYYDGTGSVLVSDYNQSTYVFETDAAGVYELVNLTDQHCTGTVEGKAVVTVFEKPEVKLDLDVKSFCALGETVNLTGETPAGGIFSGPGVVDGKFNPITAGVGNHEIIYTYTSTNGCQNEARDFINVIAQPSASLSGGGEICFLNNEEIELTIDLSGSAPFSFSYSVNNEIFNETNIQSSTFILPVKESGLYQLISMSDASCTGSVAGEAEVTDLSIPMEASPFATATVCETEPVLLEGNVESNFSSILWETNGKGVITGQTGVNATYQPAPGEQGVVTFTMTVGNGCAVNQFETSTTVELLPDASFTFQPAEEIFTGQEVVFTPTNGDGDSYNWNFGNDNSSNATISQESFEQHGNYQVRLEVTKNNCTASEEATLEVKAARDLYIPNVFHPEASNAENRVVKIYGEGISDQNFAFRIYNRWGIVLYETTNLGAAQMEGWDGEAKGNGEMMATNVFTYLCRGQYEDGETFELTGTITLIK